MPRIYTKTGDDGTTGLLYGGRVPKDDAATEAYEDLVKAGVIDPAKVTRYALQNAASIAGLMLTTEAMIAELPDEKGEGMAGMGGGGMGGMGMGM